MERELTEEEQRRLINDYILWGCHESPAAIDSSHRWDIDNLGTCSTCGKDTP